MSKSTSAVGGSSSASKLLGHAAQAQQASQQAGGTSERSDVSANATHRKRARDKKSRTADSRTVISNSSAVGISGAGRLLASALQAQPQHQRDETPPGQAQHEGSLTQLTPLLGEERDGRHQEPVPGHTYGLVEAVSRACSGGDEDRSAGYMPLPTANLEEAETLPDFTLHQPG